ncbi:unnamed protein product [Ectocarpus sp. CCAP 1310/34]|nr:unnamed protein product [Ectocarpus sp. CCAP 1310/34]
MGDVFALSSRVLQQCCCCCGSTCSALPLRPTTAPLSLLQRSHAAEDSSFEMARRLLRTARQRKGCCCLEGEDSWAPSSWSMDDPAVILFAGGIGKELIFLSIQKRLDLDYVFGVPLDVDEDGDDDGDDNAIGGAGAEAKKKW